MVDATVNVAPRVRRTFGFSTHARQMLTVARESFQAIVTNWGGLALAGMAALAVVSGTQIEHMGVPLFATAERILAFLAAPLTSSPGSFRDDRPAAHRLLRGRAGLAGTGSALSEITDAAPVPEWVYFLGKFVGLPWCSSRCRRS